MLDLLIVPAVATCAIRSGLRARGLRVTAASP